MLMFDQIDLSVPRGISYSERQPYDVGIDDDDGGDDAELVSNLQRSCRRRHRESISCAGIESVSLSHNPNLGERHMCGCGCSDKLQEIQYMARDGVAQFEIFVACSLSERSERR